ncbi:hypothetical protein E5288_WYG007028 [Bos mutus]|uniref:Uncharacterized protein n=1 Tax=Bos mutus TaxID=72004 RepID=A0A6B0QTA6_9CETA|nr:hypothetical protein [Bos mutus]
MEGGRCFDGEARQRSSKQGTLDVKERIMHRAVNNEMCLGRLWCNGNSLMQVLETLYLSSNQGATFSSLKISFHFDCRLTEFD